MIKLAPIVWELNQRGLRKHALLVHTGQHQELVEAEWNTLGMVPDICLNKANHCHDTGAYCGILLQSLSELFHWLPQQHTIAGVLAQGDTTSVTATALAAQYAQLPFLHLEAGLRTHNLAAPFPEELHRQLAARCARWHYAPTHAAVQNLRQEGIPEGHIVQTGNTVIDAMHHFLAALPAVNATERTQVLITIHRSENHAQLPAIGKGIRALAARHPELDFQWLAHPNPAVQQYLSKHLHHQLPNLSVVPPRSYQQMMAGYRHARAIVTDSGGIQEEASVLGVPMLVIRSVTERPENLAEAMALLSPANAADIVELFDEVLLLKPKKHQQFGDGSAAKMVVDHLLSTVLQQAREPRLSERDPRACANDRGSCAHAG